MTTIRAMEYRIVRNLLQRREVEPPEAGHAMWVERLIAVLATTAGVFLLGSYLQELLWVLLAVGTIGVLGDS